jgi:uncharacterized protein YutE (UPF0331/DUF86 family)
VVKPQKVLSILNSLRGYREKLGQLAAVLETEFLRDFTKVESAKHLLQISIESCIDIAHHIIADNGYRAPQDSYDAFVALVLPPESREAAYYLCGGSHVTPHGPVMPGRGLAGRDESEK